MKNPLSVGFIGGGNMASALIEGMANKVTPRPQIHVIDLNPEALSRLKTQFGVTTSTVLDDQLRQCDVIVLAVKPQQIYDVVKHLLPYISNQLVLSIAAGISTADLSRWLNHYKNIVRCMPNTPALIGKGAAGLYAMEAVTNEQKQLAETIMQAVGMTLWLDQESLLDAVTAISGSGPAYVFYFIEALEAAGKALGLDASQASALALATFQGASELAVQSTESVSVLRERVTSPAGTTFAALTVMENHQLKNLIVSAARAAADRSVELGQEFGKQPA